MMQRQLDQAVLVWPGAAWKGRASRSRRGGVRQGTARRLWNSVFRRGGAGSGASCHGGQGETRRGKAPAWLVGARRFRFGLSSCGVVAQGPAGHGVSWRLTQGVFGLGVAVFGLAVEVRRVTAWPGLAVKAGEGVVSPVMARSGLAWRSRLGVAKRGLAGSVMGVSP